MLHFAIVYFALCRLPQLSPAFAQIMRCMSNSQQSQHQHVVTLSFGMHMSPDACVADAVYRLPSICKNALYGLAGLTQLSWL